MSAALQELDALHGRITGVRPNMRVLRDGRCHREPRAPIGRGPAVLLVRPKFPHNVGTIVRACSCYGIEQLWFTGERVSLEATDGYRLPREERMKGYRETVIFNDDRPFDLFPRGTVPVAVEVLPDCESLPQFVHPENALYVFGPEDGGLTSVILRHCQRFVAIPARHCLNLSAAVYTV